jgi:2,5-dioxopentanoate dehydrogenase
MLNGKHLIAGDWVGSEGTFTSAPATGEGAVFANGGVAEVDRAVRAAEEAFWSYSALSAGGAGGVS